MLVLETIARHNLIASGDTVCVAVSGGSDSMAVLHALYANRERLGIAVKCVNVEHGIRGERSREDSEFVRAYCETLGVECVLRAVDAPSLAKQRGQTLEQAAREARYACFYELVANGVCNKVAVCHNRDDNAESVLMHLARGSGVKGVCGMDYATPLGIIRPLLDTSKSRVYAYLKANSLPWREDETNDDPAYTRNYFRKVVLPALEGGYPGAAANILRFSAAAREDEEYLRSVAAAKLRPEGENRVIIPLEGGVPAPVFKRALALALETLGETDVTSAHFAAALELAREGKNGGMLCFPHGIRVFRDYEELSVEIPRETSFSPVRFKRGSYRLGDYLVTVAPEGGETAVSGQGLVVSAEAVAGSVWRMAQPGDRFRPYRGFAKKLNEYLSEQKIPKRFRKTLPVLAAGSQILAVLGVEIADCAKAVKGGERYRIKCRKE